MKLEKLIPQLIRAALDLDQPQVLRIATSIMRAIREDEPRLAKEISEAIAYNRISHSALRSIGINSTPIDPDSSLSLVKVREVVDVDPPILSKNEIIILDKFIDERRNIDHLLRRGVEPSRSLLLSGPPGVGKTLTGEYIASALELPLLSLDIATTISSYLGRTGLNLRNVFYFGNRSPVLIFLDEFDAIAKKRDDPTDLGELKRIVNVLLTELDSLPPTTTLVAATNHAELLDKAIWRRFDVILDISMPGRQERIALLDRYFGDIAKNDSAFIEILAIILENQTGADIARLSNKVKREMILNNKSFRQSVIDEIRIEGELLSKKQRQQTVRKIKDFLGDAASSRDLATMLGVSHSTILRDLK